VKFEIRALRDQPGAPLALAVQGGPILPGQVHSKLNYVSEVGALSHLTVTFAVGVPDLPMRIEGEGPEWPNDLAAASAAFSALSDDNKARFMNMYAEQLLRGIRPDRLEDTECIGWLFNDLNHPELAGVFVPAGQPAHDGLVPTAQVYARKPHAR